MRPILKISVLDRRHVAHQLGEEPFVCGTQVGQRHDMIVVGQLEDQPVGDRPADPLDLDPGGVRRSQRLEQQVIRNGRDVQP